MMITILVWMICATTFQSSPFGNYQWKNRIIVVSADQESELEKQVATFQNTNEAFYERDLILVTLNKNQLSIDGQDASHISAAQLRDYYNLPSQGFRLLLIGKDGGTKLSSSSIVDHQKIYNLIDSMPMRKAEMRRDNGNY